MTQSSHENEELMHRMKLGMHYGADVLKDNNFLSQYFVDNLELIDRKKSSDTDPDLQVPIRQDIEGSKTFAIYADSTSRYVQEITDHVPFLNDEETAKLCTFFSCSTALGQAAIYRTIRDPTRSRTPARLQQLTNIFADRTDFHKELVHEFGDEPEAKLMRRMLDKNVLELNGMRAGLAITRLSYLNRDQTDPINQDIITACREGFMEYVGASGPSYRSTAKYVKQSEQTGIDVLSYMVPEWLIVLGFPMDVEVVENLFK